MEAFRCAGGLFDVPPCDMDLNVGKRCRFTTGRCLSEKFDTFTVVGVQKNYRGDLVYRVVGDEDVHRFGRCASPEDIEWVDLPSQGGA